MFQFKIPNFNFHLICVFFRLSFLPSIFDLFILSFLICVLLVELTSLFHRIHLLLIIYNCTAQYFCVNWIFFPSIFSVKSYFVFWNPNFRLYYVKQNSFSILQLLASDINSHSLRNLPLHQANPSHGDHQGMSTFSVGNFLPTILFLHLHHFSSAIKIILHVKNIWNLLNLKALI